MDTKIHSDFTTPRPNGPQQKILIRFFLGHDRNSDAGVEVRVITYLDGHGLPVSNHSAQLDHRLHLGHSALDALVNQTLSVKKQQNKNIYMCPLKVQAEWRDVTFGDPLNSAVSVTYVSQPYFYRTLLFPKKHCSTFRTHFHSFPQSAHFSTFYGHRLKTHISVAHYRQLWWYISKFLPSCGK